ncbi:anaerobic sulfatase maturase [Ramlibacter sp.]|uniref:anaerobic sulfatase maturase n=1 Tax=Ramlibacter sp. TaxID=1917967 RepID=UPI002D17FF73|nr:anaerobic sulfatase maturase [Ramlibacter sp.]HWI80763.1 anaerobic sulfatase maturase [Ramlibacter sp.]
MLNSTADAAGGPASHPFHVMAKPAGPACNLRCDYCFYLEKEQMFAPRQPRRMDERTLEAFVRQYIEAQPGERVVFAWQGGEPTLLGVDWYRRALALQRRHGRGRRIENTLQTNGTLLDDEWGAFLKENGFLVGISIDGPPALHDRSRVDANGRPSSARVQAGIEVLRRHAVPFNTLTCVSAANAHAPLAVYRYLKEIGSRHLQFIPVAEPRPGQRGAATPPSVSGAQWGRFLIAIFDEWVRSDVGEVYVDMFDLSLAKWLGIAGGLCVHAETCGDALAIEHDGSVYSCDHYVGPEHRLGWIHEQPLAQLAGSAQQTRFGQDKAHRLPEACYACPVLFACNGGCPKHRFAGIDGRHNHLCEGYRAYFTHVGGPMQLMADRYRRGESPAGVTRQPNASQ